MPITPAIHNEQGEIGNLQAMFSDLAAQSTDPADYANLAAIAATQRRYEALYDAARAERAVVTLQFADGTIADYTTIYPLLTARKLVAGFGIISGKVDATNWMTTAQLLTMQQNGMEILSHSVTHDIDPNTQANPLAFAVNEITQSRADLLAKNLHVQSFNAPGQWTAPYFPSVQAHTETAFYRAAKGVYAMSMGITAEDVQPKPWPPSYRWGVSHQTLEAQPLIAYWTGQIDNIIKYGGMLELGSHSFNFGGAGMMTIATLTTLLDYLQTKQNAGLIRVMTPTAAYRARRGTPVNLLGDPLFAAQATSAYTMPWASNAGTPIIAAVGTAPTGATAGGNTAQIGSTNQLIQYVRGSQTRSVRFEAWAKCATVSSTVTARMIWRAFSAGGTTLWSIDNQWPSIPDTWTKVTATLGSAPDVDNLATIFTGVSSSPETLWYEPKLFIG